LSGSTPAFVSEKVTLVALNAIPNGVEMVKPVPGVMFSESVGAAS
jgi:hypothetical protein